MSSQVHRPPTPLSSNLKEKTMTKREKLLDKVFEAALQNDMKYFG